MDRCTHTSPIKDIQPKKRDFLCLGEHEFHEFHEPKVAQLKPCEMNIS